MVLIKSIFSKPLIHIFSSTQRYYAATAPIKVTNPIVEIDGDEMAHIVWQQVKDELIRPYVNCPLISFDLSMSNRDRTDDAVSLEAACAILEHNVGVKCATITPDSHRKCEFKLKRLYKSPNATIRNYLGGTLFREPILCKNVPRPVPGWTGSMVIAQHAFGDQYAAAELACYTPGTLEMEFTPDDKSASETLKVFEFKKPGVAMVMYNIDESIEQFAHSCFEMSLKRKWPLFLSTKNTILKKYDGRFKEIFQELYDTKYKPEFDKLKLTYSHQLIDAMVAYCLKSSGCYVWACKNYDGDVQTDTVATGYGSRGMMSSVLVCPDGKTIMTEAAHGTVTDQYRDHQAGKTTSVNSIGTIFAWTRALDHRAKLDKNERLSCFCKTLEKACIDTVDACHLTKDLAECVYGADKLCDEHWLNTSDFIREIGEELKCQWK